MATPHLTKREDEIRRLVVDGLTNDAIASELRISARTVEAHLRMLFRKTGASRRDQLSSSSTARRHPGLARDEQDVVDQLERRLAQRDRQVLSYDAALQRIIDRQFPLFEERVELTVTVGTRPEEDMVVERHWTTPKPYLIYRVIRPITSADLSLDAALDSLMPTCEVIGSDIGVAVQIVADPQSRPLAMIFFQPGLEQPTEWTLRYRAPELWGPLRRDGADRLLWATGRLDGRSFAGIHDLQVNFVFPPAATEIGLTERLGSGTVDRTSENVFSYKDTSCTGARYDWRLRMRWEASS